jgi:hypothetical protein
VPQFVCCVLVYFSYVVVLVPRELCGVVVSRLTWPEARDNMYRLRE